MHNFKKNVNFSNFYNNFLDLDILCPFLSENISLNTLNLSHNLLAGHTGMLIGKIVSSHC